MKPSGYAYVEVLVAAIVLSLALVPASDALREVATHAVIQRDLTEQRYEAIARLETVLAEPFSTLQQEAQSTAGLTPSSYSDVGGTTNRHVVFVTPYDIDNADGDANTLTGIDSGVVHVEVTVEHSGITVESLRGEQL